MLEGLIRVLLVEEAGVGVFDSTVDLFETAGVVVVGGLEKRRLILAI